VIAEDNVVSFAALPASGVPWVRDLQADFDAFCRERVVPGLADLGLVHTSPYLNLYLYPDEVDYARAEPLAATSSRCGR
jgi:hypothetical protein